MNPPFLDGLLRENNTRVSNSLMSGKRDDGLGHTTGWRCVRILHKSNKYRPGHGDLRKILRIPGHHRRMGTHGRSLHHTKIKRSSTPRSHQVHTIDSILQKKGNILTTGLATLVTSSSSSSTSSVSTTVSTSGGTTGTTSRASGGDVAALTALVAGLGGPGAGVGAFAGLVALLTTWGRSGKGEG